MGNQNNLNNPLLDFDFKPTQENHSIIKVVGVGGGGSNAVDHMFETGIDDVSFLIINTDKQALDGSNIPNKLLISEKGLGAGAKPEIARNFAEQYAETIRQALSDGTEMVFITAGMGGGTGTGAAPIVAQISHELGILTVGIVTIPFKFEGKKKILMALDGVKAIEKWCDALLVVNNNRLIDIYPDLNFGNAFSKADDTLTTAAKSISDIINKRGYINLDFADVSTTLRGGGVALISTGSASGENRLSKAIEAAKTSPLLQDNKITDAKHLLFELCFSHDNPISMSEIAEMNKFVESLNSEIEVIWGAMYDEDLGDDVRIILLASGFAMNHNTGDIIVGAQLEDKVKELQQQLRAAIAERMNLVGEFDGYQEAADILLAALREASAKADILTIDDSIDEEITRLDKAYETACDKKLEAVRALEAEIERQKQKEREREILEKIEALKAELAQNTLPADPFPVSEPKTETPVVETKVETIVPPVSEPSLFDQPAPIPVVETVPLPKTEPAVAASVSKPEPVTPATPVAPVAPVAPTPRPTSDPIEGIEAIRHFYGEETANRMLLDDTRKAYYILDEADLTNEELIERLEHLPAYNRKLSDLGQLKAVSRQPAKTRTTGPAGNIEKTLDL